MASVNTQSVREEAERIKTEFQRIAKDEKISTEVNMLLQSMFMLINLLIAIFLEKWRRIKSLYHQFIALTDDIAQPRSETD